MEDKLRIRKWKKWGWRFERRTPKSWVLVFNEGGKLLTISLWNAGLRVWIGIPYPWKPFIVAVGFALEFQHPFARVGGS